MKDKAEIKKYIIKFLKWLWREEYDPDIEKDIKEFLKQLKTNKL